MRISVALFALCASPLATGEAAAESKAATPSPVPVDLVSALPGASGPADVVFLGRSGQLYFPDGSGGWKRKSAGGVSVDVVAAVRGAGDRVFAIGRRTPLFERAGDGAWAAHPLPNRGRVAAASRAPFVSIGRHIYHLSGNRWRRLGRVNAPITALWAASKRRLYVATRAGEIRRGRGTSWATIKTPLAEDDQIVTLVGGPGRQLYAVSAAGALLRVAGNKAREVAMPEELAGFELQAAGTDGAGRILLAGVRPGEEGETSLLLEVKGDEVKELEELWPLSAEDRFAVILGSGGALILATRRGEVGLREDAKDPESPWKRGRVDSSLDLRRFERRGPARTR